MEQRWMALVFSLSLTLVFSSCSLPSASTGIPQGEPANPQEATLAAIPTQAPLPSLTPTQSWESLLEQARDLAREGQWSAALEILQQAADLAGDQDEIFLLEGQIFLAQQQYDAALQSLTQSLETNPQNAVAHFSAGLAHSAQKNPSAALTSFQSAIEAQPNYAPAYRNRAEIHELLGNYEAAVLDYQIYLSLVPSSPEKEDLEARILLLQGQANDEGAGSQLLFLDDFSTSSGGWFTNGDADLSMLYELDGLRLTLSRSTSAAWALTNRIFTNSSLQIRAQKLGGSQDNYFGLMCRIQGTTAGADFYMFIVSSDGYYGIGRNGEEGSLVLLNNDKLQRSPDIPQGEEPLTLLAECDEDRLALFVNDVLIAEVYDEDLSAGQAGLFVGTFAEAGTDILFDDFQVISLAASP